MRSCGGVTHRLSYGLFNGSRDNWLFWNDQFWIPAQLKPDPDEPSDNYLAGWEEDDSAVVVRLYEYDDFWVKYVEAPEAGMVSSTGFSVIGSVSYSEAIEIAESDAAEADPYYEDEE